MKALIVGAGGGLGRALASTASADVPLVSLTREELDIADEAMTEDAMKRHAPGVVFNCAAWTDVDGAEREPGAAAAVNERGAALLAAACARARARLIHVSTDFVFSGDKGAPYTEDDRPAPLGAYGKSKLAGEERIRESGCNHLIVRTSWLYSLSNDRTFPHRVLEWARTKERVELASDHIGSPTHADALARALWTLAGTDATGTLHWAGAGAASRHGFGEFLIEEAREAGARLAVREVAAVPASHFPMEAPRPRNSSLECTRAASLGAPPNTWQDMAREFVRAWVALSKLRPISSRR